MIRLGKKHQNMLPAASAGALTHTARQAAAGAVVDREMATAC